MHLRFHDPFGAADAPCGVRRFFRCGGYAADWNWNAVALEQLLGLVFVQIHRGEISFELAGRPRILEEFAGDAKASLAAGSI
jgi:hypothetical protein